jgi:hypothetical protein
MSGAGRPQVIVGSAGPGPSIIICGVGSLLPPIAAQVAYPAAVDLTLPLGPSMNGIRREQNSRGLGYRSLRSVGAFTTLVRNCSSKGVCQQFHYDTSSIWGSETAVTYKDDRLSVYGNVTIVYGNVTIGRNLQRGVATGQFNFPADELAFIDATISCWIISRCTALPLAPATNGSRSRSASTRFTAADCAPVLPTSNGCQRSSRSMPGHSVPFMCRCWGGDRPAHNSQPAGPRQFDPAGRRDRGLSIGLRSAAHRAQHRDRSVLSSTAADHPSLPRHLASDNISLGRSPHSGSNFSR